MLVCPHAPVLQSATESLTVRRRGLCAFVEKRTRSSARRKSLCTSSEHADRLDKVMSMNVLFRNLASKQPASPVSFASTKLSPEAPCWISSVARQSRPSTLRNFSPELVAKTLTGSVEDKAIVGTNGLYSICGTLEPTNTSMLVCASLEQT